MTPLRVSIAAVVSLVIALTGSVAPANGDSAGNPVSDWNAIAVSTLIALPGPGGGAPPAAQVNVGMVQGAVYDAVNSTEPKHYRPYLLKRRFSARADQEAAVATAAYRMLVNLVNAVPPTVPFPTKATVLANLATQYDASLADIPDRPAKDKGIRAGQAAADAMIAARQNDGRFGPSQWVPNSAPGHWQPLLNAQGQPLLDPTPWAGGVKPFLMESSSQFRTPGPLALGSAAYATEFNDVKSLGSEGSTARTAEQKHIAQFWQSTPVATWNKLTRDLVARFDLDVAQSARLFAMQNLTGADAAINCWNDKYHYDFWRPWNAIARAGEDGNSATEADGSWKALITAPYPEHPSGHMCLDGAHLTVLETYFDSDAIPFDAITLAFPGETRHFASFSQALAEIRQARVWAGLHFLNGDVQGEHLGRNVADYMFDHYFQRVGASG